jgi:hypothetical protein
MNNDCGFIKFPKALLTEEYSDLDSRAKFLYSFLLDRMNLSKNNIKFRKDGRIFVICTIEEASNVLCVGKDLVIKLYGLLKKFMLIDVKRQGRHKPNLIFVNDISGGYKDYNSKSQCNQHNVDNMESPRSSSQEQHKDCTCNCEESQVKRHMDTEYENQIKKQEQNDNCLSDQPKSSVENFVYKYVDNLYIQKTKYIDSNNLRVGESECNKTEGIKTEKESNHGIGLDSIYENCEIHLFEEQSFLKRVIKDLYVTSTFLERLRINRHHTEVKSMLENLNVDNLTEAWIRLQKGRNVRNPRSYFVHCLLSSIEEYVPIEYADDFDVITGTGRCERPMNIGFEVNFQQREYTSEDFEEFYTKIE